ncbi:hypothetical protein [Flavobacterium hungaricum]|uniref:DUF3828 domain-containing protein n=1 Tax=Flavobacterium hungaricum TaxID=2082725 RepID=A0ABR9TGG4_9FLAO|nr:hypothetical protein [Flavobacterium hungaricum]MBE8724345.1 hypothetical protein [Flavobacterium hungaricum]
MIRKTLSIFLAILFLQSCNIGTSGTWKNDTIENEKRDQIKALNDQFFKALMTNNVKEVKTLLSDKLLEKGGNEIDKLIGDIYTTYKADSYRILDEYNVENTTTNVGNTIPSGISKDNDYVINYLALNKDMYVSLLIPNGHQNELLITLIYGKYGDEWKINIFHVGQYSFSKKTAPDFHKLAQESYKKSYLIDAINYSSMAKKCLRPGDEIFKYQKENDINTLYDKLMAEANAKYTFPLTLENVNTKPVLYSIQPQMIIDQGYSPMVWYISKISVQDTTALKVENEKVKTEVNNLFAGINKDKKYVFYRISNEIPDGKKLVRHFGIIDKLKE